jgi:hypothetical protein
LDQNLTCVLNTSGKDAIMKLASSSCTVFTLLLTVVLFSSIARSLITWTARAEDAPIQGLQLSIFRNSTEPPVAGPPKLRVELRNTGKNDLILNLGMMLAKGRKQYAKAIVLILTDSEGKSRTFDLREPAIVAGRVDPMVVPLPIGATYSLPIDLNNYWPAASKEFEYKLRGAYTIEAKFSGEKVPARQDLLLALYWIGAVTSNRLTFEVSN